MHPDLKDAIQFHHAILAEGGKALVGYETAKALANIVLLSEIPTTYDKKENRQVNAGNMLIRGVPGVGKTFFGVILAAISDAKFARIQGRADLQPTEVVGFQMINPATGELITEFGPMASAEVILLDEINRIPLKSQSAFLEGLQDRTVTVGKTTYELPAFSFAIATMNPVELGQGTFPLSEAATDRFAVMINVGYLPASEEAKLVNFDFKHVRLNSLMSKERIIQMRSKINEEVFLHERLGTYIQQLVSATRPHNPDTDWNHYSPSELVERGVDLGASPRAIIVWGRGECGYSKSHGHIEVVSTADGSRACSDFCGRVKTSRRCGIPDVFIPVRADGQPAPECNTPPPQGESCVGLADGWYCSARSDYSAYECKNQQVALGYQCATGKKCVYSGQSRQATMQNGLPQCR